MTSSKRPKGAPPSREGAILVTRQGRHSKPTAALAEQIRQSMLELTHEEDDDETIAE
jgi:hypothetical protein